jgi:molybdenum cofactor synthesis domain-containing protein
LGKAFVLTVSDGVSAGVREDRSGAALRRLLSEAGFAVDSAVVPDEREAVASALADASDGAYDLVVSTGGTGLGPRDVTPQATLPLLDYTIPGLAEEMRRAGAAKTPMAVLSRSLAGVRGRALILNLPGSERGATESLEAVLPVLDHALQLLRGETRH